MMFSDTGEPQVATFNGAVITNDGPTTTVLFEDGIGPYRPCSITFAKDDLLRLAEGLALSAALHDGEHITVEPPGPPDFGTCLTIPRHLFGVTTPKP